MFSNLTSILGCGVIGYAIYLAFAPSPPPHRHIDAYYDYHSACVAACIDGQKDVLKCELACKDIQ